MDPRFRINLISATPNPQQAVYAAMHQDYFEGYVFDEIGSESWPNETRAGEIAVKRLLKGNRGHFGSVEHPQIILATGGFPHSVMQQARTHRTGVSFDVQSMRYTGERICRAARGEIALEDVFYLRPVGSYSDRQGKRYSYTEDNRAIDLEMCRRSAIRYAELLDLGHAEEHARGILAFDFRQNFVVSFNLRSAFHFLDLRAKLDAQLEIRAFCDLLLPHISAWAPQITEWYIENRLGKARLSP